MDSRYGRWFYSIEPLIYQLDPNGEDSSVCLAGAWSRANRFGTNQAPSFYGEYIVALNRMVGVLNSLLSGHALRYQKEQNASSSASCFYTRPVSQQDNLVFVLMPFTENWSDVVWKEVIKNKIESIQGVSLNCRRADDLFGQDVMKDIYESIVAARIVIADITGKNANVFYELGMAHAFGKDVILLSQSEEHIPFDLNRFRHCIYSDDAAGYQKLTEFLEGSVKSILGLMEN